MPNKVDTFHSNSYKNRCRGTKIEDQIKMLAIIDLKSDYKTRTTSAGNRSFKQRVWPKGHAR